MSRYLLDRIEQNPRISVRAQTQVTALTGSGHLVLQRQLRRVVGC